MARTLSFIVLDCQHTRNSILNETFGMIMSSMSAMPLRFFSAMQNVSPPARNNAFGISPVHLSPSSLAAAPSPEQSPICAWDDAAPGTVELFEKLDQISHKLDSLETLSGVASALRADVMQNNVLLLCIYALVLLRLLRIK